MKATSLLATLVLASVLALTGCVRVQVDLTLTPEDTVNGTMVMALQSGIGQLLDTTDAQIADELFGEAEQAFDDAEVTPYEQDDYVGSQVTFEGQPMGKLALGAGDFTITREGDEYIVNGVVDANTVAEGAEIPATAQMSLKVTFPGEVYEHNGSLEGNTVTWDLANAPAELHAVGGAEASTGAPVWLSTVIGTALLLGVGVMLMIVMRHRGNPAGTPSVSAPTRVAVPKATSPQPTLTHGPDERTSP